MKMDVYGNQFQLFVQSCVACGLWELVPTGVAYEGEGVTGEMCDRCV